MTTWATWDEVKTWAQAQPPAAPLRVGEADFAALLALYTETFPDRPVVGAPRQLAVEGRIIIP